MPLNIVMNFFGLEHVCWNPTQGTPVSRDASCSVAIYDFTHSNGTRTKMKGEKGGGGGGGGWPTSNSEPSMCRSKAWLSFHRTWDGHLSFNSESLSRVDSLSSTFAMTASSAFRSIVFSLAVCESEGCKGNASGMWTAVVSGKQSPRSGSVCTSLRLSSEWSTTCSGLLCPDASSSASTSSFVADRHVSLLLAAGSASASHSAKVLTARGCIPKFLRMGWLCLWRTPGGWPQGLFRWRWSR